MFRLFKKKSPTDKLYKQYDKLMKESYILSTSNRRASDEKATEANTLLKKIEELEGKPSSN